MYFPQVLCVGQIICAVAAETDVQAKRAIEEIKVTYEDLEPVIVTIEVSWLVSPARLQIKSTFVNILISSLAKKARALKLWESKNAEDRCLLKYGKRPWVWQNLRMAPSLLVWVRSCYYQKENKELEKPCEICQISKKWKNFLQHLLGFLTQKCIRTWVFSLNTAYLWVRGSCTWAT